MGQLLAAAGGLGGVACQATRAVSALPPELLARWTSLVRDKGGYDLQQEDLGTKGIQGWEGFPTRLYAYHAKKERNGTRKRGLAVMLNPAPEQVARWLLQAVQEVKGGHDELLAEKLLKVTSGASGFQFLVRGVHWEDMNRTGVNTAYTFRDGVTVRLKGLQNQWPTRALTEQELSYALDCDEADVMETMRYARIQSTTREMYRANGGTRPVTGHAWRAVVRQLYQAAWGQDRNELMVARARSLF